MICRVFLDFIRSNYIKYRIKSSLIVIFNWDRVIVVIGGMEWDGYRIFIR